MCKLSNEWKNLWVIEKFLYNVEQLLEYVLVITGEAAIYMGKGTEFQRL